MEMNLAVGADIIELVRILNEEGFEAFAGELLSEIALGRDLRGPDDYGLAPAASVGSDDDSLARKQPIPESEQLGYAMRLLRLRLVEPIRRLAEAERIAGRIHNEGQSLKLGGEVRIAFVPIGDGDPPRMDRQAAPGDDADADELVRVLEQIAPEIG